MQRSEAQQIKVRPSVHLTLDRFQFRDLPLCLPVRPFECAACLHCSFVLADLMCKLPDLSNLARFCVYEPPFKLGAAASVSDSRLRKD